MTRSMTAFASRTGAMDGVSWQWDMRGVNARGLDLRLRVPDGLGALETTLRKAVTAAVTRGSITLNLKLVHEDAAQALSIDAAQLDRVLGALDTIQERAFAMGVTLGQPTAADVLATRGVVLTTARDDISDAVRAAIDADIPALIADFTAMRDAEGAALQTVMTAQLDEIGALVEQAAIAAADRRADVQSGLTTALRRIVDDVTEIDDTRIAQELALLAVKADVTEEIDRLRAHVTAARDLVMATDPSGRKLDFLAQEFNREANTLCSKAGAAALTAVGLDLKAVIDRMREQIQNVE
ncbi:YicC/YloC family endoribonuclease [Yoonia sp. 208BN28-4]|uniref:YicC/YloC family endoribonuclease n=1 Tax=Yoonia sp. 208BN28-4 TaxID=3126505 RepID=UPI00309EDB67